MSSRLSDSVKSILEIGDLLDLWKLGLPNKQIAKELNCSKSKVEKIKHDLYYKYNIDTKPERRARSKNYLVYVDPHLQALINTVRDWQRLDCGVPNRNESTKINDEKMIEATKQIDYTRQEFVRLRELYQEHRDVKKTAKIAAEEFNRNACAVEFQLRKRLKLGLIK